MSYECVKLMRTKYYLLCYYETGFANETDQDEFINDVFFRILWIYTGCVYT